MPKINLKTIGMLIKKRWYYYGFFSLVGFTKSGFVGAIIVFCLALIIDLTCYIFGNWEK